MSIIPTSLTAAPIEGLAPADFAVEGDLSVAGNLELAGDLLISGGDPHYDVRSFGAVSGAAAADTTAAFLAALAAMTNGGVLLAPEGIWNINASLVFPVLTLKGIHLKGLGVGVTKIVYSGTGYAVTIDNSAIATAAWFNSISDLTIDCSGSSSPTGCISIRGSDFALIRRCYLIGPTGGNKIVVNFDPGTGGATDTNYYNVVGGCNITGQTQASDIGIRLMGNGSPNFNGANSNIVRGNRFATFNQAVLIDGGDTNRIEDNEFNGGINTPVKLQTANTVLNKIIGNQFDGGGVPNCIDIGASVLRTVVAFNSGSGTILNNGSDTMLYGNDSNFTYTEGASATGTSRHDSRVSIFKPVWGLPNNVNGTYTATGEDYYIRANAGGGAFTVTLPAANAKTGQQIHIRKVDGTANAVTVSRAGSDLIDAATTVSLASNGSSVTVVSNGSTVWQKVTST